MKKVVHKNIIIAATFLKILAGEKKTIDDITPNEEVDSIFDIDFPLLISRGYKSYIFDVDNTLVPACHKEIPEEVIKLFSFLKQWGCKICIVSNNAPFHVKKIADQLDVPFVASAGKPLAKSYDQALHILNSFPGESIYIGDQMITDILGANKSDLYTILTRPIDSKTSLPVYLTTLPQQLIKRRYDGVTRKS